MAKVSAQRVFTDSLGANNPVFAQILGICSTLAVTNYVYNTAIMCLGLTFVTAFSSFTISLLRKVMPARVRMMVETLIIASFVIVVDIVLRGYLPQVSRQLGPYVGLIITNCIIMGRAEAFGLSNPPPISLIDGLASGLGYSYVLLIIATFRELLGAGSFMGVRVFGAWWTPWSIMMMAPGAFFMLAVFVWVVKGVVLAPGRGKKKLAEVAPAVQPAVAPRPVKE